MFPENFTTTLTLDCNWVLKFFGSAQIHCAALCTIHTGLTFCLLKFCRGRFRTDSWQWTSSTTQESATRSGYIRQHRRIHWPIHPRNVRQAHTLFVCCEYMDRLTNFYSTISVLFRNITAFCLCLHYWRWIYTLRDQIKEYLTILQYFILHTYDQALKWRRNDVTRLVYRSLIRYHVCIAVISSFFKLLKYLI